MTSTPPSLSLHPATSACGIRNTTLSRSPSCALSRSTIPQSKKIRVESGSGRTSHTGPPSMSASRGDGFGDAAGERGAVEPVMAEHLRRRSARRPAFDAEDLDQPTVEKAGRTQRAQDSVSERAYRGMVLDHEDTPERGDGLGEPVGVDP